MCMCVCSDTELKRAQYIPQQEMDTHTLTPHTYLNLEIPFIIYSLTLELQSIAPVHVLKVHNFQGNGLSKKNNSTLP